MAITNNPHVLLDMSRTVFCTNALKSNLRWIVPDLLDNLPSNQLYFLLSFFLSG